MKIHSDTLQRNDIHAALNAALLDGVMFDVLDETGSRSRARAFTFRLEATEKPGRRRRRNTGQYGAEDAFNVPMAVAATYDEHGKFFAQIFARDPEAIVGQYKGAADFHAQTKDAYRIAYRPMPTEQEPGLHRHEFAGQALVHDHPGLAHGYFEHDEDRGNGLPPMATDMRAEDMDRDERGSLTDLGREQLVDWSIAHGLIDPA